MKDERCECKNMGKVRTTRLLMASVRDDTVNDVRVKRSSSLFASRVMGLLVAVVNEIGWEVT